MDINRKIAFKCPISTYSLPEDYDETKSDFVDCNEFWTCVENDILMLGYPGQVKVRCLPESPNMLFWAPYIGCKTRHSNLVYNTEHRKASNTHPSVLETDCRAMSEERMVELLTQSKPKEVADFAKKLGISQRGSKIDNILAIIKTMEKDDQKFNKAFKKIWGSSGGWASAVCPHGIVHAIKFVLRAESPRDFVDILLSMKNQPNITVIDMANMLVVAHGNKRKDRMFHPSNGMVVEPTDENIRLADKGSLRISLPWVFKDGANPSSTSNAHPITGSSVRMCLFDTFHQTNVTKKREILRRVGHIAELRGILNTQVAEQLFSPRNMILDSSIR
ncbi:HMG domain-containing protein 3-like [Styela clava]